MSGSRRVLEVFGPRDGGVPEHVARLAEGLPAHGWTVEAAAPAGSSVHAALLAAGVPVHPLALSRAPGPADLRAARALRALDAARGYAVVHAHSSKAGALVRGVLPRPHRLVYTPHCFAFLAGFDAFAGAQRAAYRAVEQALVPRTGALIAVSAWERDAGQAVLRGLRGRASVVHNGVAAPPPGLGPDPALAAWRGDGPLVGLVARLDPQKDPLALVAAAARLRARGTLGGRVAVVGNGGLRESVEAAIARAGLGDRVRHFPYVGPSAHHLLALDALVLPSRWESFPIAVLEAMACGRAVVATDVGGTREAVRDGETGRLVAPGSVDALADALEAALADPAGLRAMGEAGRARHGARFTLEAMVAATSAVYDRAADGPA